MSQGRDIQRIQRVCWNWKFFLNSKKPTSKPWPDLNYPFVLFWGNSWDYSRERHLSVQNKSAADLSNFQHSRSISSGNILMRFLFHIWHLCLKLTQMIFPDRPNVIGPKKIKILKISKSLLFQAEIYFTERNDSCYLRISFSSGQFGGKRQLGEGSVGVAGDYPLDWSTATCVTSNSKVTTSNFFDNLCPFYICSWLFSVHCQCPFPLSTLGLQWNPKRWKWEQLSMCQCISDEIEKFQSSI